MRTTLLVKKTVLGTQQDDTPSFHGSLGTATRFSEHEQERKPIAFFLSIRDPRAHGSSSPFLAPLPAVTADKHSHACSENTVEGRAGHVHLRTARDKDTHRLGPKRREGNPGPLLVSTRKQKGRGALVLWL